MFGLDLADVKTFFDEVPKVPKSAYQDLKGVELDDLDSEAGSDSPFPSYGNPFGNFLSGATSSSATSAGKNFRQSSPPPTSLVPMFSQPGGFPNFFDLLRDKKVCLENAYMGESASSVRGTIRVQNVGFHKRVSLLYTTNEWLTQSEMDAHYMQGSCDGFSDKFTFDLRLASSMAVGQRLQFCLRYEVNGEKFWDNNLSRNYVFQCLGGPRGNEAQQQQQQQQQPSQARAVPQHNRVSGGFGGTMVSHSPSVMSEDPWLRYL